MKLSILVMTTPRRRDNVCQILLKELERQSTGKDVEILCLYDNKKRSVGSKRNNMLSLVNGEYLVFIDDDDWISDTYINDILEALTSGPDLVTFNVYFSGYGEFLCKYAKGQEIKRDRDLYLGPPAHTHVWKTSLVKDISFEGISNGEDMDWCRKATRRAENIVNLDKVLYFYRFSREGTETQ
jgi:glycosyltransferase involved in cell wall biosynthesis